MSTSPIPADGAPASRSLRELAHALSTVGIFASLSLTQRELAARAMVARPARRGDVIFTQGEPGQAVYVVLHGSVLIQRTNRAGHSRAMTVVEAPGSFGEIGLVDGRGRSASAEALEPSELYALPREEFLRLLRDEPLVVHAVLRDLGRIIRRLTDQLTDATVLDLNGRVAKTLVRLVEARRAGNPDALPIVALSQARVAELAGGSRQSVNAALSVLAQRGLVRVEGRRIVVLDLPGLRGRAGLNEAAPADGR